jgi:hypothetical protein
MRIGDTFKAEEVIHDGALGWDVELRALIIDSECEPVLAVHPVTKMTYIFDRHGPDEKPQWIKYYDFGTVVSQFNAVAALL